MSSSYAEHQEKISKIYDSDFLSLTSGQKFLEFGCGVGALSRKLALQSPHALITAIDINTDLIELAKIKTREQNIKNITFRQADASSVQDLPQDYDGAYCRFLLEEFSNPSEVIKSMSQFVKTGGWVCAYERLNAYSRIYPHSESVTLAWKAIYEFYKNSYGASPAVAEDLSNHFTKAGLENISTQGFTQILSKQKDQTLFKWYIEAALSVLEQMQAPLLKNNLIAELHLKKASGDYKNLLSSAEAFILEVSVCTTGTKVVS